MDTQRWERIGDIFEQLLGVPQTQRPNLLDSLCGDDAEMRHIVASMLESEDSVQRLDQGTVTTPVRAGPDRQAQEQIDAALIGTRVGPWRLQRKVGTGGMGVVWLAERADGQFEQRVALKLIKRGMDSDAVLARFLRERQILARLEHPHIAHLIDGGVATDGRPYFAMEYVDGVPLMHYCHERAAKLEERIILFLDICAALQFAHEHHVVHRDLKPSNVLVTAKGAVKLLDFGIAKVIEGDDGIASTLTDMQRERPMTPAYAAPEQIAGEKISEKTDVYTLGCVLYELLTGQHAHDFSAAAGARDVLRIVQTTDPVAPSRLKLAHAPVSLRRLRGDLDTIVLTALKRAPERRYASVAAFAADLRCYLAGKPIAARRDNVFYRGYKFFKRHRSGVGVSAVGTLAMLGAIALVAYERATNVALAPGSSMAIVDFNNLSQAKENAWLAPALSEMLATQLALGGKLHALPDELVRPARADLAAPLAGGYAQQSLTTLHKRLGADYVLSGSYLVSGGAGDTRLHLDLALQDARSGAAIASVAQSGALVDLPTLVEKAGSSLREKSGFASISASEEKQVGNAQPPSTEVARRMGLALDALNKSDPARAKDELLEAVALAPSYAPAYMQLAQAWKMLGYDAKALAAAQQAAANSENLPTEQRLQIQRELSVQKADWRKAVELDQQLLAANQDSIEAHLNLVDDLLASGKPDEAEGMLAIARKLTASTGDPRVELKAASIADARGDSTAQAQHAELALQQAQARDESALAARAQQALASARDALGQRDAATTLIGEAIRTYQGTGNPHGEADARVLLAIIHGEQNQLAAEREEYQRALEIYQRIGDQGGIALIYRNLLAVLWLHGDRDGAQTAGKHALEIFRETGNLKGQAEAQTTFAVLQMDEAADDTTMQSLKQAIDLNERGGNRAQLIDALSRYAEGLRRRGALVEAEQICRRVDAEVKQLGDPNNAVISARTCAQVSLDQGNIETGIAMLEHARAIAATSADAMDVARIDFALAQIDFAQMHWSSVANRLQEAAKTFAASEAVVDEADTQSLLALCYQALDQPVERNRAATRSRELRSRITARYDALTIDIALAQLHAETGERHQAIETLLALADDAEKRQWLADAFKARLAALMLFDAHDPAAKQLRAQLETAARARGFGGVLARLPGTQATL